MLKNCTVDEQRRVIECLIHSGKQRSYLGFESISFIVEFINQLDDKSSLVPIWPLLEPEICKPLSEQTLDTLYALLVIDEKFPKLISKNMVKYFGRQTLINEESVPDLLKILTVSFSTHIFTVNLSWMHFKFTLLIFTEYTEDNVLQAPCI